MTKTPVVNIDFADENAKQIMKSFFRPEDFDYKTNPTMQADYEYFKSKYSWQTLDDLSSKERLVRLFGWKSGTLAYDVMNDAEKWRFKKYGSSGMRGSNQLPVRFDGKEWIARSDKVVNEADAIKISNEYYNAFKCVQMRIESQNDFASLDDYVQFEEFLKRLKSTNPYFSYDNNWFQKTLHMLYPSLFVGFYVEDWTSNILLALQITPKQTNILRNGQLSLISRYLAFENGYVFGDSIYKRFQSINKTQIYYYDIDDDMLPRLTEWQKRGVIGVKSLKNSIGNSSNRDDEKKKYIFVVRNRNHLQGIICDLGQSRSSMSKSDFNYEIDCKWCECLEKGIAFPFDEKPGSVKNTQNLKVVYRNLYGLFATDADMAVAFDEFLAGNKDKIDRARIVRNQFVQLYSAGFRTITSEYELVGEADSFCSRLIYDLEKCDSIDDLSFDLLPLRFELGELVFSPDVDRNSAFNQLAIKTWNLIYSSQTGEDDVIEKTDLPLPYAIKIASLFDEKKYLGVDSEDKIDTWLDFLGESGRLDENFYAKYKFLVLFKNTVAPFRFADNYSFLSFLDAWCDTSNKRIEYIPEADPFIDKDAQDEYEYEKSIKEDPLLNSPFSYDYGDIQPKEKEVEASEASAQPKYKRDPLVAANALAHANYKCEIDPNHITFIRKKSDKPYTESHHLIPMRYSDKFEWSLDREVNIVSLCSHCHNLIHYGKDAPELLKFLYAARADYLKKAGIGVSEEGLLELYGFKE